MTRSESSAPTGVHLLPDAVTLPLQPEKSLLELSLANRVPITHACGGLARCSTCRVVILEGAEHCSPRTPAEQDLAGRFGFDDCVRLACQTQLSGTARIRRLVLDEEDVDFTETEGQSANMAALGDEIVAAILFCDIRGFTPFSHRVMPYDTIHMLNRFYATLGPQIVRRGGEINNTMGDGFLAIFPHIDERAACKAAVEAGLALLKAMDVLREYAVRAYNEELRIGIGIHSGPVVCGIIGHGVSRRTTIIGENVNLASRIETATKRVGHSLLVSSRVHELVGTPDWIPTKTNLDGISEPVCMFNPLPNSGWGGF